MADDTKRSSGSLPSGVPLSKRRRLPLPELQDPFGKFPGDLARDFLQRYFDYADHCVMRYVCRDWKKRVPPTHRICDIRSSHPLHMDLATTECEQYTDWKRDSYESAFTSLLAKHGYLALWNWALERSYARSLDSLLDSTKAKQLAMAQYLYTERARLFPSIENQRNVGRRVFCAAIASNSLTMYQWASSVISPAVELENCSCDVSYAWIEAVSCCSFEILDHLLPKLCKCDSLQLFSYTAAIGADYGNDAKCAMLCWLHGHDLTMLDSKLYLVLVQHCRVDHITEEHAVRVLRWLMAQGCPPSDRLSVSIMVCGLWDLLEAAIQLGIPHNANLLAGMRLIWDRFQRMSGSQTVRRRAYNWFLRSNMHYDDQAEPADAIVEVIQV